MLRDPPALLDRAPSLTLPRSAGEGTEEQSLACLAAQGIEERSLTLAAEGIEDRCLILAAEEIEERSLTLYAGEGIEERFASCSACSGIDYELAPPCTAATRPFPSPHGGGLCRGGSARTLNVSSRPTSAGAWMHWPATLHKEVALRELGRGQRSAQATKQSSRAPYRAARLFAALALLTICVALPAAADVDLAPTRFDRASIPAGSFESVLPASEKTKQVSIEAFQLDAMPVTNAEFAAFVRKNAEWQRDAVVRLFADEQYLSHWSSNTLPEAGTEHQPVTHVSWFAASAYCESRGARLPTWHEWEFVAAASDTERDARSDPHWRQQILAWYSKSGRGSLPDVGLTPANVYGVRDLHGVVWEWIEDLPALLVANDSREQGDPSQMRFCGAGAISMEQKENYAMLMRIAMLSSMKASYTSATMGFRCAADGAPKK